jgi:hypothetical protein
LKWIYLVGLTLSGSSFILIKGAELDCSTGWLLRIIFAAVFFITDWFQEFVKDSKKNGSLLQ